MQVVESFSLVSVPFREAFSHPYISCFHLLLNGLNGVSVTCFCTFLTDSLPSFNWCALSVGGEELKWHQLARHQLMSQLRLDFSSHSKAKTNVKSTNLRKNGIYWYK